MPESLLVVDDDESLLDVCETGLRLAGYRVATEPSGERALKRLEADAFDLVLTDLQMPGMDGQAVVRWVKARRPSIEVIVMTATPTLQTAVATLKEGAYDYLLKPFGADHLVASVRRCLDHRRLRMELGGERALRRELEAAYQELQKVEKLKEAFLARVSHELKTPLSELMLSLHMITEKGAGSAEKYLVLARSGARRLSKTVENLLDFVELQQSDLPLERVSVDLERECRRVVERLRPLWEPRRVDVSVAFEPAGLEAPGDAALLAKAFEHLLHNAVVFNREGGEAWVRGSRQGDEAELLFEDTGEGIPESEQERVFDSFYQIADYLTRKVEGLGLGLASTRRIIEAHGGRVGVSRRSGGGSVFRVRLPLKPQGPPSGFPVG